MSRQIEWDRAISAHGPALEMVFRGALHNSRFMSFFRAVGTPARSSWTRPRRVVVIFIFSAFASLGLTGASGAEPQTKSALAPLDAYFGPFKLSAIEIRHRIDALGVRYHSRTISDGDLMHDAGLLESAMDVWQRQYPRDSWIVPTIYHLEQLYQAVQTNEARAHATTLLKFLIETYPKTPQAHLSRLRLAQGFPPLRPETATRSTPNPYGPSAIPATATATPAAATSNPAAATPAPMATKPAPTATIRARAPARASSAT
jgi:hypothetical protein